MASEAQWKGSWYTAYIQGFKYYTNPCHIVQINASEFLKFLLRYTTFDILVDIC